MEKHTGKVRFGVVGTNFITDWVIAGARRTTVLNWWQSILVSKKRQTLSQLNIRFLILLSHWKRW